MKATELIAQLQKAVDEHGDLPVVDTRNGNVDVRAVEHQTHDDDEFPESLYIW